VSISDSEVNEVTGVPAHSEAPPRADEALLSCCFEDLEVGRRQRTRGRTVTEADIVTWCSHTADWYWLHSDAVAARDSLFGQRIAPGIMVYAFATGLGVPAGSRTILANYGADKIRYPRATYIGDTIHLEAEVLSLAPRDDTSGVVTLRWDAVNQDGWTVCASTLKVLLARRAEADGAQA
jgi:3-hydroxybutyryl-CoA dehydratase